MVPDGWAIRKIGDVLDRVVEPVGIDGNEIYQEIGIRSHGKGIFHKEPASGASIGEKRVFWVQPNCFIVNIVFAWEQAIARTTNNEKGKIASHRFPMYRPVCEACDVDFLTYYFNTPTGKYLLGLASPGGAGRNKTLGQKEFEKLEICMPNGAEQKKIARILSTWDRAIDTVERLIANSKAQKKALMQQLLTGKRRFPGFEGEWRLGHFGEGIKLISGQHIEASYVNSDGRGVPYLTGPADFPDGHLVISKYTDAPKVLCENGDILITVKGSGTGKSILSNSIYCISRQLMAARATKFDRIFAFNVLQSGIVIFQDAASGLIPGISRDDVLNFRVFIPPEASQILIGNVLTVCDKEKTNLEQQVKALMLQKKSLMQQLLTGKRRVKVDQEVA